MKWWFARDFGVNWVRMHVWQFATLSWNFGETAKEVVRVGKKTPSVGKSSHLWFSPQCFLFEMCGIVLIGQFFSTRFSARFTSCAAFPMTRPNGRESGSPWPLLTPAWPPMAHEVLKFRRSMGQTRRMSMTTCMAGWFFGWTSEIFLPVYGHFWYGTGGTINLSGLNVKSHRRIDRNTLWNQEETHWSYPLVNFLHNELERSTMLFMGKSTISAGPFSIALCLPEGRLC